MYRLKRELKYVGDQPMRARRELKYVGDQPTKYSRTLEYVGNNKKKKGKRALTSQLNLNSLPY